VCHQVGCCRRELREYSRRLVDAQPACSVAGSASGEELGNVLGDLTIRVCDDFDHVTLTLRGRLTLRSVPQVREATVKWLLNTGQVVIDLSRLRVTQTAMVSVFPTALDIAGGWPLARLVLFGADATLRSMLKSTRVPDTVPLADDLPAAHVLLHRQPPCVRRYRDLPMHQSAPAAAREFVRGACAAWSVPQDTEELAELVVNELVTNAVQHAQSSSRVTLTGTESALRISVRDYRPSLIPRPHPIDIAAPSGRGLHLVTAVAHTWGTDQHLDGKTVWAYLAYPADRGTDH
jgi:anti-sigma regulatory factor (Ser/Thr protein kinase)/ABC-type transporter Mla MlaB component